MRIRITFSKLEELRFIGHLDLFKSWERTFRRAGLSLTFSKGMNPHPKINLASPLPLGYTSSGELMDVFLNDDMKPDEILAKLNPNLPPGLDIISLEEVSPTEPKLQALVINAEYRVEFQNELPGISISINALMSREEVIRERKGKTYDLRPRIKDLWTKVNSSGITELFMILGAEENNYGRPDEVLFELDIDPIDVKVQRTRLITRGDDPV